MRSHHALAISLTLVATTGCHSPYVSANVTNRTSTPIDLLEVDYPSASFGTQNLAPGAHFTYRFKVLGSGQMKIVYTDSAHHDHTATGPTLHEGAEGPLAIDITPTGVNWTPSATVTQPK